MNARIKPVMNTHGQWFSCHEQDGTRLHGFSDSTGHFQVIIEAVGNGYCASLVVVSPHQESTSDYSKRVIAESDTLSSVNSTVIAQLERWASESIRFAQLLFDLEGHGIVLGDPGDLVQSYFVSDKSAADRVIELLHLSDLFGASNPLSELEPALLGALIRTLVDFGAERDAVVCAINQPLARERLQQQGSTH